MQLTSLQEAVEVLGDQLLEQPLVLLLVLLELVPLLVLLFQLLRPNVEHSEV